VLRQNPRLFLLILLAGCAAISGWPLLSLLPAFAERVLHEKERAFSLMLSSVGIGALLAALTAATFSTENRQQRLLVVGVGSVSIALLGLSQVEELAMATLCCGLFGFGMILFFATGQAAVQLSVTRANRGKVMGVWVMMLSGGTPVGNLIFGPAADEWGVATVVFAQGVMMSMVFGMLILQSATRTSTKID
jgi:predicted MFS family arabinose efflux permease